jgi:hypothetical protein
VKASDAVLSKCPLGGNLLARGVGPLPIRLLLSRSVKSRGI